MTQPMTVADFKQLKNSKIGVSEWVLLTQEKVNQFADVTGDHQFIHIDPKAAKLAGFGGTIVHGYFLLSLVSRFLFDLMPKVEGKGVVLNYGLNKVRFLAPVPVGSRVRGQILMKEISERRAGQFLAIFEIILELEGQDKPVSIAEQLILFLTS